MPGASANGRLASSPIAAEPIGAAMQVATKAAPWSIPAPARIGGLTTTM